MHKSETVAPGRTEPAAAAGAVGVGAVDTGAGAGVVLGVGSGATGATADDVGAGAGAGAGAGSGSGSGVDVAAASGDEKESMLVTDGVMASWGNDCVVVTGSAVVVTKVDVTSAPPGGTHIVVTISTVSMTCCVTVYHTISRFAKGTAATKPTTGARAMIVDVFMFEAIAIS